MLIAGPGVDTVGMMFGASTAYCQHVQGYAKATESTIASHCGVSSMKGLSYKLEEPRRSRVEMKSGHSKGHQAPLTRPNAAH